MPISKMSKAPGPLGKAAMKGVMAVGKAVAKKFRKTDSGKMRNKY